MLRKVLSLAILIILSFDLYSQKPEIQFDRLSVKEGLLDHSINCIIQDHIGFIWIGGSDGLYRYDGYDFTTYQYQPGKEAYKYFREVYKIRETRDGLFWILSESGIILFDPELGKAELLYDYVYESRSDEFNVLPDLIIDSNQNIWVSYRQGLMKISCPGNIKEIFENTSDSNFKLTDHLNTTYWDIPDSKGELKNIITRIYEDRDKNILAGTVTGLFILKKGTGSLANVLADNFQEDVYFDYVRSIIQDKYDAYWIITGNYVLWAERIDSISTNSAFSLKGSKKYTIDGGQVPTSLLLNHQGDILVGTVQDIYIIERDKSGKNISFNRLDASQNDPEYYGYAKTIRDIFEDRSYIIWTAQDYYGITKFRLNSSKFNSYKNLIVSDFKSTDINPIYRENDGSLWIGTYGAGLYNIRKNNPKLIHYDLCMGKNSVICMEKMKPGIFWIGTQTGIVEFNSSTGQSYLPTIPALSELNNRQNLIWDIINDGDKVFLATFTGLYVLDIKTGNIQFDPWIKNSARITYKGTNAISLFRTIDGSILSGSATGGIIEIKRANEGLNYVQLASRQKLSEHGIKIESRHRLYEDKDGIIWIADYSGLHSMDKKTGEIKDYRLFDKINFPVAWSIIEDDRNNLWIGTHFGLCRFNKLTKEVRVFTKSDGLPITIHGQNSVMKDPDGRLFFGGIGGFYNFYPDSLVTNISVPPVVITGMTVTEQRSKNDSSSAIHISDQLIRSKNIRLSYDQNNITFSFAALDFNKPLENQYYYKLDDEEWVRSEASDRSVTFNNLGPGTYLFRVRGSNSDGTWNNDGTSVSFTIRKPWWTTYFALLMYALIGVSVILLIFRWRLFRLNQEREELEKQVALRTYEIQEQTKRITEQNDQLAQQNRKIIEDEELKSRFFTNISHEFRTPLSLIKNPVEDILDNSKLTEKDRKKLLMVSRNSERLLTLVNQLLDLSKFDNKKMILELCQGNILDCLQTITIPFTSIAESRSIDFVCDFEEVNLDLWFDHDKIEKIASNLLSNAFKFTPVGGNIRLVAKYIYDPGSGLPLFIEFSITDNGPGIPEESIEKIFDRFYQVEETLKTDNMGTGIGLSLSRDLARLMHGDISVKSEIQKGSTFTVRLPTGMAHLNPEEYVIVKF